MEILRGLAVAAYLATIIATPCEFPGVATASMPVEIGLTPDQLHRFEGIFIYFGFLLLLFSVSEK